MSQNRKYYYRFDGDGLRYELEEFISLIANYQKESYRLSQKESIEIARIIEKFRSNQDL